MLKLMLLSVLLATFVVPVFASKIRNPRAAMRALLLTMFAVELAYAFFLRFLYDRLL